MDYWFGTGLTRFFAIMFVAVPAIGLISCAIEEWRSQNKEE